jgi:fructose 1,6-bisphosphatase
LAVSTTGEAPNFEDEFDPTGSHFSSAGDEIAALFPHSLGKGREKVHQLAWDPFLAGTKVPNEQSPNARVRIS